MNTLKSDFLYGVRMLRKSGKRILAGKRTWSAKRFP